LAESWFEILNQQEHHDKYIYYQKSFDEEESWTEGRLLVLVNNLLNCLK